MPFSTKRTEIFEERAMLYAKLYAMGADSRIEQKKRNILHASRMLVGHTDFTGFVSSSMPFSS